LFKLYGGGNAPITKRPKAMTKKDTIREFIRSRKNGYCFSIRRAAEQAESWEVKGITEKDIDNVCRELLKVSVLSREKILGVWIYKVNEQAAGRWFEKHPIAYERSNEVAKPANQEPQFDDRLHKTVIKKAPAKRRTPFVMAIDAEIAALEAKIKRLHATRKEFV
jgi:hypothetical protein